MPDEFYDELAKIELQRDRYITSAVSVYQSELFPIIQSATGKIISLIGQLLDIVNGRLLATPKNMRFMRTLDKRFMDLLDNGGYSALTEAFVNRFDGQLPYFQRTIELLSRAMKRPLPQPQFTQSDLNAFGAFKASTIADLENVVWQAGAKAARHASYSVGGLPVEDLTSLISEQFARSVTESYGIAETAMSTYGRTINDRGTQIIEGDLLDNEKLTYTYAGPLDKLNRQFCKKKMREARNGKTWTRAQIDRMDNGTTLKNVMLVCGGWRCRHQWAVAGVKIAR